MNELLKKTYLDYLQEYEDNAKALFFAEDSKRELYDTVEQLNGVLDSEQFNKVYDAIDSSVAEVQSAFFIIGFAYCAKLMSNGKIDFFPNDEEVQKNS